MIHCLCIAPSAPCNSYDLVWRVYSLNPTSLLKRKSCSFCVACICACVPEHRQPSKKKKECSVQSRWTSCIPSPKVMEVYGETLTHTTGLIVPRMTPKASETTHWLWSLLWTQTVEESKANWATEDTAGLLIISLIKTRMSFIYNHTTVFVF